MNIYFRKMKNIFKNLSIQKAPLNYFQDLRKHFSFNKKNKISLFFIFYFKARPCYVTLTVLGLI